MIEAIKNCPVPPVAAAADYLDYLKPVLFEVIAAEELEVLACIFVFDQKNRLPNLRLNLHQAHQVEDNLAEIIERKFLACVTLEGEVIHRLVLQQAIHPQKIRDKAINFSLDGKGQVSSIIVSLIPRLCDWTKGYSEVF